MIVIATGVCKDPAVSAQYFNLMSFGVVANSMTLRLYLESCGFTPSAGADSASKPAAVNMGWNLQLQLFGMWQEKVWRSKKDSKIRSCLAAFPDSEIRIPKSS